MVSCSVVSGDPWRKAFTTGLVTGEHIWAHLFQHSFVIVGHTVLNIQRCQCCSQFLIYWELICSLSGCNLSFVSNEFISTFKKSRSSVCCCWPDRATRVKEFGFVPFVETAIREARLTVLLTTALTPYTFFNRLWMSSTDPFAMKFQQQFVV